MTPRRLIEPARLAGGPLLRTQTDERLVDLTRAGNDRAFEAIVHRYRRPLLRYCSRLLPGQRAEDAVQQAFVSAYSAMCSSEAELKLRPWLYRIAHNAALNLLRQNGWDHEEIDETARISDAGPELEAERNERLQRVLQAVGELPERQRDAVVLRALEGRSYDEIATELDVSGGAVRQLLNRARTTLRSAATALTPPELLVRLGGGAAPEGAIAQRVAEVCAGGGGAAALAKLGAAVVVAGAVAGSAAVDAPVPVVGGGGDPVRVDDSGDAVVRGAVDGSDERATRDGAARSAPRSDSDGDRSGGDPGSVVLDSSGPGGGGSDDDVTRDDGDSSGPGSGSDDGGGDSSGPGPGGDLDGVADSSGPGSGDLVDRSGPSDSSGSSGSGSSGSGSSGSGSGSGSSSDSSGPG